MSLDKQISEKYMDMPKLDIDLTEEDIKTKYEQAVYNAIDKHLAYLNELIIGLRARVQASLRRMDLMEARA